MSEIEKFKAGMADAYWYEWYVGLANVLDMLNSDKNIECVILQHENLQGLDDVVIKYKQDGSTCIQVKHTKTGDKISFSDLIYHTKKKKSLLYKTAKDWGRAKQQYGKCNAVLYTNREAGIEFEVKGKENCEGYIRPDLKQFYSTLKNEINGMKTLEEFGIMYPEWNVAWNEWCEELNCLDIEEDKLNFIQCLEIKTEEKDLEGIIEEVNQKLERSFNISREIASQLDMKLCYALRAWTTELRTTQEITKEVLYQALSIADDEEIGVHDIQTQEPVFPTRRIFVDRLGEVLSLRKKPIVFLYGEPGCGKTNIVSDLTQRADSIVSLRFYAFKPLTVKDTYLMPDGGIYDARTLWGNLLIGLRQQLKGHLAEYNVPPVNAFMDTIDKLRNKVLELAECLSQLNGQTTVIVIDGIDHAVRAGQDNSFIKTLPMPEMIPPNVCFLISGQLMTYTDYYPEWLTDDKRVLQYEVPKIGRMDIEQIYDNMNVQIPSENKDEVIRIIANKCEGNTLAAIFTMHEAERCKCVKELENIIDEKKLSVGITEYYEYIWKSAVKNIPNEYSYLESILAGVLSLLNKQITPNMLVDICDEISINQYIWKAVLDGLFPIIIEKEDSYLAYHNDIRVYLEKRIKKNTRSYQQSNAMIAEYLFNKCTDVRLKHENIFRFFSNANREKEYIKIFTYQYVYEGIRSKRPWNEIIQQLDDTLKFTRGNINFDDLVSLNCSVSTIFKYRETLNWIEAQHVEENELPKILESERKVFKKKQWTISRLEILFGEILLLIDYKEFDRANAIYDRWMGNINPEQLYDFFKKSDLNDKMFEDRLKNLIEEFGIICRHVGIKFQIVKRNNDEFTEGIKDVRGYFSKGWLNASKFLLEESEVEKTIYTLEQMQIVRIKEYEEYFMELIGHNILCVSNILKHPVCNKFSNDAKIEYLVWAIINGQPLPELWVDEVLEKGISFGNKEEYMSHEFMFIICKLTFILEYLRYDLKRESVVKLYYKEKQSFNSELQVFNIILDKYKYFALIFIGKDIENYIFQKKFENIVIDTFEYSIEKSRVFAFEVEQFALNIIMRIVKKFGKEYNDIFLEICIEAAKKNSLTHIDLYWDYLRQHNCLYLLEELYDYWMSPKGKVWQEDIDFMYSNVRLFIKKAKEIGWSKKANNAEKLLANKLVGYVGTKEYGLSLLHRWYKRMNLESVSKWQEVGIRLLNLSEKVSEIADNRNECGVITEVAQSAGKEGYESLWQFAILKKCWNVDYVRNIFDGIIAALEKQEFSKSELINIWDSTANLLPTYPKINGIRMANEANNDLNHIYVCDVRKGIILAAQRLGIQNIEDAMQQILRESYYLNTSDVMYDYKYPTRWFGRQEIGYDRLFHNKENNIIKKTYKEIFDEYKEKSLNSNGKYSVSLDTDSLVKKLEKADEITLIRQIPLITRYIIEKNETWAWNEDGTSEILDIIFKFLDDTTLEDLLDKLINDYIETKERVEGLRLQRLHYNLEEFILYQSDKVSQKKKLEAFEKILNMHINWISGFGTIPIHDVYELKNTNQKEIKGWNDLISEINSYWHKNQFQ